MLLKTSLVLNYFIILLITSCESQQMNTMENVIHLTKIDVCSNSVLDLVVPTNSLKRWYGFFHLDHFANLTKPVNLTIQYEESTGSSYFSTNIGNLTMNLATHTFLTNLVPPKLKVIEFNAIGWSYVLQIKAVYLNGENVCPKPKTWNVINRITIVSSDDYDYDDEFDNNANSCGRRFHNATSLISNGFASKEGVWPWHVGIYHLKFSNNQFAYKCGGSLINVNTILTAAHCVYLRGRPIVPDAVSIHLGRHNLQFASANVQEHAVIRIIPHEEYNPNTHKNDIALLRLASEATFNSYVSPVCLWKPENTDLSDIEGKYGTVVGWGYTEKVHAPSDVLNQGSLKVVNFIDCLESDRNFFSKYVSNNVFCAGRNTTSACNGDSGGGLYFEKNGIFSVRGIVSLSAGVRNGTKIICDINQYVLFTDAAKYLDWIDAKISETFVENKADF